MEQQEVESRIIQMRMDLDKAKSDLAAVQSFIAKKNTSTITQTLISATNIPQQFSTSGGTLSGAVDGVNATYTFPATKAYCIVAKNGVLLTAGLDYTFTGNAFTLDAGQIAFPGDTVTAIAW